MEGVSLVLVLVMEGEVSGLVSEKVQVPGELQGWRGRDCQDSGPVDSQREICPGLRLCQV